MDPRFAVGSRPGKFPGRHFCVAVRTEDRYEGSTGMGSGSENRQRTIALSVRLTPDEAALVQETAGRVGVSVAGLIRYALLQSSPPRASRVPTLGKEEAARLLGTLGMLAVALKEAAGTGGAGFDTARVNAMQSDLADMRAALLEALGRSP